MKTAISIDQELFAEAENYSRISGLSRSRLYSAAIKEYLQNNTPNIITEKLNDYYRNHESRLDYEVKTAACRLFSKEDW